jgi:molybdate transport system substrate-binding protein
MLPSLLLFLSAADPLLVAAASDLAPLDSALKEGFGQPVSFTYGSTGMLARQIENGAPFDVLLAADDQVIEPLIKKGRLEGDTRRIYAIGRVAVWSKAGTVRSLEDLAKAKVIAIANPAHAPYGRAAQQALEKSGLLAKVKDRLVMAESVRQAFQFAESGNADACLTSWSLVYDKGGVQVDDALHQPLRQVAAVNRKSKRRKDAYAFLEYLVSDEVRSLFATRGFNLIPAAPKLKR